MSEVEMSFEDAAAELGNAIEADASASEPSPVPAPEQAQPAPTTPEGEPSPQVQSHWSQAQPRDPATGKFIQPDGSLSDTPPAPVQDTFDGGKFNPDSLAPELQPAWKQLQAAYTQKTQQLAEEAKQFEGIDPAQAREALDLYEALQDPNYLRQFHSELSEALQSQGLSPAQADAEAARQVDDATGQPGGQVSDQLAALRNDPELAPVAETLSQLQAELQSFKDERAAEREAQELAQWQLAMAGEIQRQESVLMQQGFGEQDIERVHELAAFHDGNLLQAAESLKAIRQEAIEAYLSQKQAVEPGVGPVPGDGGTSEIPVELNDLDEGLKAALGHLAQSGITTLE